MSDEWGDEYHHGEDEYELLQSKIDSHDIFDAHEFRDLNVEVVKS